MMTMKHVLDFHLFESSQDDFVDLPTAIQSAKADGYIVDGIEGELLGVNIDAVPTEVQSGPDGNFRYVKGEFEGEAGMIYFYEPTTKLKEVEFVSGDGQKWRVAEVWYVYTAADREADEVAAEEERQNAERRKVTDEKVASWVREVYDALVKAIEAGEEFVIQSEYGMNSLRAKGLLINKVENIKVSGSTLRVVDRYKGTTPSWVSLTLGQVSTLAAQVGVDADYTKIFAEDE